MTIKENDFLVINLSYKVKGETKLVDSTFPEEAKELGIKNPKPKTIIVHQNMILKGVDEALIGKEEGQEFSVDVPPEKGFGKRNADLIKMMPMREFKKQKVTPYPGMQFTIDGLPARIITVSAGRIMVDLNFPLAGRELEYRVKIEKVINDSKEKINILLSLFNLEAEKEYKENSVIITLEKEVQDTLKTEISKKIKEFTDYETKFEVKNNGLNNKERPDENGTNSKS